MGLRRFDGSLRFFRNNADVKKVQYNLRTADGDLFHHRAPDEQQRERRGDTLILRGLPVVSD